MLKLTSCYLSFSYPTIFNFSTLGSSVWIKRVTYLSVAKVIGLSLLAGAIAMAIFYLIRQTVPKNPSPSLPIVSSQLSGGQLDSQKIIEQLNKKIGTGLKKVTLNDGRVLEGEFKDGKLNGQGKVTRVDGIILEGEFQNGNLHGLGRKNFPNGEIHEGLFKNNSLNGQGKATLIDGKICQGEFQDGQLHGQGMRIIPHREVHEGEFKNGNFFRGQATKADGKKLIGEFNNGRLIHGKIILPNGIEKIV